MTVDGENMNIDGDTGIATRQDHKIKRPSMYQVVLLNDDYTPMEFVTWLLIRVFHKSEAEASRLMLQVHTDGRGVAGRYTHDAAKTKVFQVQQLAEKGGHPLQAIIEKAGPAE